MVKNVVRADLVDAAPMVHCLARPLPRAKRLVSPTPPAKCSCRFRRDRPASGFEGRQDAPLTPRHSAGAVGMWEAEHVARVGLEVYYTGQQRLEANPYRTRSRGYVSFGLLAER